MYRKSHAAKSSVEDLLCNRNSVNILWASLTQSFIAFRHTFNHLPHAPLEACNMEVGGGRAAGTQHSVLGILSAEVQSGLAQLKCDLWDAIHFVVPRSESISVHWLSSDTDTWPAGLWTLCDWPELSNFDIDTFGKPLLWLSHFKILISDKKSLLKPKD